MMSDAPHGALAGYVRSADCYAMARQGNNRGVTDLHPTSEVGRQLHRFPRRAAILQHPHVLRTDVPIARRDAVDLAHELI